MIETPNLHINKAIYQYLNTLRLGGERGKGALFLKKSKKQSRLAVNNIRWILSHPWGELQILWMWWLWTFHSRERLWKHPQISFPACLFILYILNTKIITTGLVESIRSLKGQLQSWLNPHWWKGWGMQKCGEHPSGKKKALVARIYEKELLSKHSRLQWILFA